MTAPDELNAEFSVYIGRIAASWSSVENSINWCIWAVAGIAPTLGACITSQIYTIDGRFKALLALLKFRQAPDELIKAVNKLAEDSRGPSEIRNRIIHDPWLWNPQGEVVRFEITAPKKLRFELVRTDLEKLKADFGTIRDFATRTRDLRKAIYAVLPALPEIPREALYPITDNLQAPQSQATEKK